MKGLKNSARLDTEIVISVVLRIGVTISAITIGLGLLLFFITGKSGYPGSTFPTSPFKIVKGLVLVKPYAIILAGLFLLIMTPVLRVAVSILTFLKEKDYLYTVITAIVFIILMVSLFLGKG
jgi:uncharacterized membrane protein